LSISRPLEVLTVIHDKMDHAKTASPCFANRIKTTDGFFKLHVPVTGEVRKLSSRTVIVVLFFYHDVLENIDSLEMVYLDMNINSIGFSLQE
jgi:hypothetical protein